MSNSDEDMFLSQKETRISTEVEVHMPKSQPQRSDVEYLWVVAFHWDIGDGNPFTLQPICNFTESEVPSTWYAFKLRDDLRKKKINVRMLSGEYSIFCKVEKGKQEKCIVLIADYWCFPLRLVFTFLSFLYRLLIIGVFLTF